MTYDELTRAIALFDLPQRVTLRQIKNRHRELVKRYHPDGGEVNDPELIRAINAAYKIIRDYVENYRYSFAEEEFYEQNPDEQLRRQFADAPLWGSR